MKKSIRVLIARLGMDAHWRGSIVVARALRDAGMEVVYVGNQMPEGICRYYRTKHAFGQSHDPRPGGNDAA